MTPHQFGIDQGPVVLMIENYRTGLIWDLMRRCPPVVTGLRKAGFTGGWLWEWPATVRRVVPSAGVTKLDVCFGQPHLRAHRDSANLPRSD